MFVGWDILGLYIVDEMFKGRDSRKNFVLGCGSMVNVEWELVDDGVEGVVVKGLLFGGRNCWEWWGSGIVRRRGKGWGEMGFEFEKNWFVFCFVV